MIPGWVEETLNSPELGIVALPAMFVLGFLGLMTNCCTPAVLGAVAGFSGGGERRAPRAFAVVSIFFMVGTLVALAILGAVAGFVGQIAGQMLGRFFQIFAGFVVIFFGLAVLGKLPFRIPQPRFENRTVPTGGLGAAAFGFTIGGASIACMLACNPLVAVPLGVATIHGKTLFGAGLLAAFALGYSLALTLLLAGLGAALQKVKGASQRVAAIVKVSAGVLLIAVGFYMLGTVR